MSYLLANFPPLSGRFSVGCQDFEYQNTKKLEQCKSVLMRLYYPASIKKTDTKATWISHANYGKALCDIAKLPAFLSNWLSHLASVKKTRFYKEADIFDSKFPVVVFSHGLGGNRLIYSCICSDLASHGFIVAAIEHRDGSASLAKGILQDEWIQYDNVPPEIWGFRHHQLRHRVNEVELCLSALDHLNHNDSKWKNKMNMESLVMAGHSFGGATTMLMLNEVKTRFKCGLLLDPWAQPLMMLADKHVHIKKPVIAILSEQFSFWPDNYESVQELINNSKFASKSVCLALTGTEHQHQSDVLLVLRYWTLFDFRNPFQIDPARAIDLNTEAAVTFINNILSSSTNRKRKANKNPITTTTTKKSKINLYK